MTSKKITPLAIVVMIGLVLQALFVLVDCTRSEPPADTAISYARAYYRLSPTMTKWLSNSQTDRAAAANHVYATTWKASECGFSKDYARFSLYDVETRTYYKNKTTAVVHLTAKLKRDINPVFAYIARLFRLGDTYEVNGPIRMTLENGQWRVASALLPQPKVS